MTKAHSFKNACKNALFSLINLQQRGQPIAAVSRIASDETFLRPSRVIERNLLELCVLGALEDINRSGETGVSQTMNAVQVMKLVNDFLFTPGDALTSLHHDDQ